MISVIIPAYNTEKTIRACLKSLLHQTISRDNYEIIVVDDGSSDSTKKEISKFPTVRYFYQARSGESAARNLGIQKATGDIIVFIDADCEAREDFLKEITKPISDLSVSAVKGAYLTKQKSLVARLTQIEFEERYSKMQKSTKLDFVDNSASAYRKSIFYQSGLFDNNLLMSMDTDLAYRLEKAGHKIVFNPNARVYHLHPDKLRIYWQKKFWRSYWRMDVYKNYPKKIFKDSYTPQTLKLQILIMFFLLFSVFVLFMVPYFKYLIYFEIAVLLGLLAPLTIRAFRHGIIQGLIMPFFVIGRAVALGLGILYYFLEIKNFRELLSFILLALIVVVPSLFTGGRDLMARAIVFVLAFPFLFFILRSDKEVLKLKIPLLYNIFLPLLIFFIVILFSIFFSVSHYDSYYNFLHWLSYAVIFMGVFYLVTSKAEAHKFAYLLIFLAVILSIIGIYFFTQTEFYNYLRAISTFYQHNPFAGFLLFPLPLSFVYLFFEKKKKIKIILFFITILLSLTFVLTHSRGAWLSFALPLIIILFFALKQRQKWLGNLVIFVIILALVGLGWWGMTQLKSYQAKKAASGQSNSAVSYSMETPEENAVVARLHFWEGAKDIFFDHPVFGTGFGTFNTLYRQYLKDIRYYSIDPHNIYLKVLSEMGVIGAIPFFWFVLIILIIIFATLKQIRKIERDSDKALLLGLSTGLLGALAHNFVEVDWQFPTNLIVFFVVLGVLYKLFLIDYSKGHPDKLKQKQSFVYSKQSIVSLTIIAFFTLVGGVLIFFSSSMLEKANNYLNDYKPKEAESSLKTALKIDPFNYDLHYSLSYAYYYLVPENVDFYKDLYIKELEKTISLNKSDYHAYESLGIHYLLSKDFSRAEELLNKAVVLNPVGKPELYLRLASAYYNEKKYEEAIKILETAVGHYDPSLAKSIIWVAEDRQKIINDISQLYNALGEVYYDIGKVDKAKQYILESLQYNPDNQAAMKNLAEITVSTSKQKD